MPSIPFWTWLFVSACAPLLLFGGLLPAVIGVVGMGACVRTAQRTDMVLWQRLATCLAATACCWALVIGLTIGWEQLKQHVAWR